MAFKGSSRASEPGTDNSYNPITIGRGCRQAGVFVYNSPPSLASDLRPYCYSMGRIHCESGLLSRAAMRRLNSASLTVCGTFNPRK
jgi:hypothetical protein